MRQLFPFVFVFFAGWFASDWDRTREVSAAGGLPDFSDVIARTNPSVVRVSTRTSRDAHRSRDDGVGAGFVVRADGIVVTSLHVVSGAQRVLVTIPNRGTVDGEVLGCDPATDIALLRVPLQGLVPLAFGNPDGLRLGAWVLAAGAPYEMENSWSVGIVSGLHRSSVGVRRESYQDYIQTDAAANLGNSGGPLVDASGRAVGVMSAILSRTGGHQGVALAVPMDAARAAIARLLEPSGEVRPRLGVRVREMQSRISGPIGLWVTGFDAGSPAPGAGVRRGDVILMAAGEPVGRPADLQRVVWSRRVGDVLDLTVRRGTQQLVLQVRLN